MRAKIVLVVIVNLFVVGLFIYGCASATGPLFTETLQIEHQGKAKVYFFRNSQVGSASTLNLQINKGETLPLMNKGYYLIILEPGTYSFTVSHRGKMLSEEKFTFSEGETYYLRFYSYTAGSIPTLYGSVGTPGSKITTDPRDKAIDVLKKCRLIEVPQNKNGYILMGP